MLSITQTVKDPGFKHTCLVSETMPLNVFRAEVSVQIVGSWLGCWVTELWSCDMRLQDIYTQCESSYCKFQLLFSTTDACLPMCLFTQSRCCKSFSYVSGLQKVVLVGNKLPSMAKMKVGNYLCSSFICIVQISGTHSEFYSHFHENKL